MTVRRPPFAPGQTIGLLGGAFDPRRCAAHGKPPMGWEERR
jgi:hypothetical protein